MSEFDKPTPDDIVNQYEHGILHQLASRARDYKQMLKESEAHALGCGCHQCALQHEAFKGRVEEVINDYRIEKHRQYDVPMIDEEEAWIMAQAFLKLGGTNEQGNGT